MYIYTHIVFPPKPLRATPLPPFSPLLPLLPPNLKSCSFAGSSGEIPSRKLRESGHCSCIDRPVN